MSARIPQRKGRMLALMTPARRVRPINSKAAVVGTYALLVLLSIAMAPVARAQGDADATYLPNVKVSDVRFERGIVGPGHAVFLGPVDRA